MICNFNLINSSKSFFNKIMLEWHRTNKYWYGFQANTKICRCQFLKECLIFLASYCPLIPLIWLLTAKMKLFLDSFSKSFLIHCSDSMKPKSLRTIIRSGFSLEKAFVPTDTISAKHNWFNKPLIQPLIIDIKTNKVRPNKL